MFSTHPFCFVWIKQNKNGCVENGGGSRGKAWHIWDKVDLFSHSIYIIILFFYSRTFTIIYLLCFLHDKGKKYQQVNNRGQVVTARLDTFGVKFRSFLPYLFFQPTASLFFYSPDLIVPLCGFLCWINTRKTQRGTIVGGSRGKAWHICDELWFCSIEIIYFS